MKKISLIMLTCGILMMMSIMGCQKTKSGNSEILEGSVFGFSTYNRYLRAVNEVYDTEIVVYGEDIPLFENVKHKKITEINDETLKKDHEFEFIVINDISGTVKLTEKEINVLKNYVIDGTTNLIYMGNRLYPVFIENGFLSGEETIEMGFGYLNIDNRFSFIAEEVWSDECELESGSYRDFNICVNLLFNICFAMNRPVDQMKIDYEQEVNEIYDTDIVVYGEDTFITDRLDCRKIEELNRDNLENDHEYEYLIINDLAGTMELTKSDIEILKEYVIDGKTNLIYLGENMYPIFEKNGFLENEREEGENGFAYTHFQKKYLDVIRQVWSEQKIEEAGNRIEEEIYMNVADIIWNVIDLGDCEGQGKD